jgi:hypothetical protein
MIHPEVADEAVGLLLMLVSDLGEEAASLAVTACEDPAGRFARLRQISEDQAILAAAGEAVVRNRRVSAE